MNTQPSTIQDLQRALEQFAQERDWEQFHTPKNLVMALSGEVGELTEIFQWLTADESKALTPDLHAKATDEIADVAIYLFRLATLLNVDILDAVAQKLHRNADRYPVEKARGSARKYTDID